MISKKLIITTLSSLAFVGSLYGAKIKALKTPIAEESFQLGVVVEALKKLGHKVEVTNDVGYDIAFQTMASNAKSGDVYFMAAMWDPVGNSKIEAVGGEKNVVKFDKFIENCAQGYLVDKKTADKYKIKYIDDLKNPKIAKLFDLDGDNKADLAGCNHGWACEKVIEHQLDAYALRDTIKHNQGEYSALISDVIANYKTGKSILYYAWTPYWVSGKLVPGKDVVFLQVKKSANPYNKSTKLANGKDYGFSINDQRIVANASVKTKHKDIAKLFNSIKINVNDISAQNMLMAKGQDKTKDIDKHVALWIKSNQELFNSWIEEAKKLQK